MILSETYENQLDISILNVNKYLTSDKRKEEFIWTPCTIEQKTDGIKVNIIKISSTGDNLKDFVVSYHGNIIYPTEFEYASTQRIKLNSINMSQFKVLFEHLKHLDLSKIPESVEFFVEFACKKPTLSSNYTKHGFVLLAYSRTTYSIKFGKLKSNPTSFNTKGREKYAKIFKFNVPKVVFDGILGNFERGVIDDTLKSLYQKAKQTLNPDNMDDYIAKISEMILTLDSPFGGKEEGVVLNFPNGLILKIQQAYQCNQVARKAIKANYQEIDPENEAKYWEGVRRFALEVVNGLPSITEKRIPAILEILAKKLKYLKPNLHHSKKSDLQILDDIQLEAKNIILRKCKGNNNFLFLGKFRVLTIAHYNIIKYGLKNFDGGVVCLVSSKDTRAFEDLRMKMLKACFPNIEIITHTTGYLKAIMQKSPLNINAVLCGTDRFYDYTNQLKPFPDVSAVEVPRTDEDISATKVIENLDNYAYFCIKTPKEIHKLYKEIKATFDALPKPKTPKS